MQRNILKNNLKFINSLKSILVFCFLFFSCNQNNDIKLIRIGHGLDTNHSVHKAMIMVNNQLLRLSDGKMKLEIYPNQQLGSERECLELLQIGSLDLTKVSAAVLENFAPKVKVFGLPYLFENKEHYFKVLDGPIGKELLEEGEKYLFKGLGYYDSGSRSFYSREKKIEKPSDLNGLKIRVQESNTAFEMIRSLGGSPTPISWGELYTSLQQGVVDAAENNTPSFYLSKHYEVCKYYIVDEHNMIPDVILSSTNLWNNLTFNERKWLQEAVNLSVPFQRELWIKSEEESMRAIINSGVEIIYPDKDLFKKAMNKHTSSPATTTFKISSKDLDAKFLADLEIETQYGTFKLDSTDKIDWVISNIHNSQFGPNTCYIYNKAMAEAGEFQKQTSEKNNDVFKDIRDWADARGLYSQGDVKTQLIKLYEESGELSQAILKDDKAGIIDAIGDSVVVLTNLAHLVGTDIETCINSAYSEISNRTGRMINGTFVKDE